MQFANLKTTLCSISAIPVTPFTTDGQVDFAAYHQLIGCLVEAGITVVTPNGNTGEFYALSPEEQRSVVEAVVEVVAGRAVVMAGVGFDLTTAIDMARFAVRAGARALMIHQPIHPYQSAEGWIAYNQAIAEAAPEVGIVPYVRHPAVTGAALRRLTETCPNLVAVKYGINNPLQFASVVQEVSADRLAWLCGTAELWAPFFWLGGARGFTSGLVNVQPALSLEMLHCLQAGDYAGAMEVWRRVKPFEEMRGRRNDANNVPVIKEALAQMGLCSRMVRPPITEMSESERAEIATILVNWGIGGKV